MVRWYVLLTRRFLKKRLFTVMLLAVPVLVFAMRMASSGESGVLHVALVRGEDEAGAQAVDTLLNLHGVIQYEEMDNAEAASEAVRTGAADCAWIFPENLKEELRVFAKDGQNTVFEVYTRVDSIQTQLAREQLYGVIYPILSYELTDSFLEKQDKFADLSEEERENYLSEDYAAWQVSESLFSFVYLDETSADTTQEAFSYLTAPLRGMLSLFVMLCALAVTMFYLKDREEGIFSWMRIRMRRTFPLLYILTGTIPGALAAYAALYLSGTFTNWQKELPLLALYVLALAGFCNCLRILVRRMQAFGAAIPVLLLVSLVLCPVFLNVSMLTPLQRILPAFYYLSSLHSISMLQKMEIYTLVVCLAGIFLENPENL
jgi:ABC-2 type transport system permease protein